MKRAIIMILALLLVMTSCAGNKKSAGEPEWLTNPESRYPSRTYITAIGSGFSRSDAEQDAAGKLARIFRSDVQTSEITELRYEELTRGAETETEDYGKVTRNIQLSAEESLINIQFGESFTDEMGKVHSIAYLERFSTATIYEEMISGNSEKVNYYLKQSSILADPLDKYAYAGAAWTIAIKNEDLLRQVKIISPSLGDMISADYEVREVEQTYHDLARGITFTIIVENDEDQKITSIIKRLLTQKGFRISDTEGYLTCSGKIIIEKTDLNRADETIFYRWELALDLTNPQDENILTFNPKGRSGSVSDSEAISRVYRDLEKELNKTLLKDLDRWFDNIVLQAK
ncbi:MAG: LPP20 family lipoprotein [Candidatus Cloacimonetes bacterium]|nr:LPP20 family lipoprotein [Candidatus Cloacimonadota bacterium]